MPYLQRISWIRWKKRGYSAECLEVVDTDSCFDEVSLGCLYCVFDDCLVRRTLLHRRVSTWDVGGEIRLLSLTWLVTERHRILTWFTSTVSAFSSIHARPHKKVGGQEADTLPSPTIFKIWIFVFVREPTGLVLE